MRGRRGSRVAACLLAAFAAGASFPPAADGDLETRIFEIRFKAIEDVILLIEPHIGEHGSYTVQPRLRALTVRDEPARIARIAGVIANFDQPPRSVRVAVQLLDAVEAAPARGGGTRSGRGARVKTLLDSITKWSEVSVIGTASIVGVEGANSTLNIADRYRVRFSVDTIAEPQGVVRFERFALDRIVKEEDGAPRFFQILDTVLNLRDGQPLLIGATPSQDSQRALFLSLTATLEPAGPVPPAGGR